MNRRGLLHDASLEGITSPNLTEEERAKVIKEHGIQFILDRVSSDTELRIRLRQLLENLPADKPGRKAKISDERVYMLISLSLDLGVSMDDALSRLAKLKDLKKSSVRTKYYRGKKAKSK